MTPSVNAVLAQIRTRLNEDAVSWGPESRPAPSNHSQGKPGEGGATNETNVTDALDAYLEGIASQLQANYGKSESSAYSQIMSVARRLHTDGTLPAMPGESADDAAIAEWLGKAASVGFTQLVLQDAGE